MSKDYKKTDRGAGSRSNGGSLLVGILIGLVLGLSIALAVAWYINRMPSPFLARVPAPAKDASQEAARTGEKPDEKALKGVPEGKPRFDFYKILPGEQPGAAAEPKQAPKEAPAAAAPGEREAFFLQAGAFQSAPDADNLKARLALIGFEASVQTAILPDKGVWHRVRIGPYASIEELNRARETLKQNGYETTLVKAQDAAAMR
ncbi:MAG: SPOR domain-containing protein [Burkholderiales bacterium]|nr:SPOR domain-containing protein [Burkholderiales bacterium]